MKNLRNKAATTLIVALFIINAVGLASAASASAKIVGSPITLGVWHFDNIEASGDNVVTPDSNGYNSGILGPSDQKPALVESEFVKALSFNGNNFVYVPISFLIGFPPTPQPIYIPISPTLNAQNQIKIDAWINVQDFTEATYNNVAVKCTRTDDTWQSSSRVVGLAIRGTGSEDGVNVAAGTLTGFVRTESGAYNEIVAKEAIVPLNQWIHVTFTRTETGMHLYVDGHEQAVNVIHGVQNPVGRIMNGTEVYFGHDANLAIDELTMVDLAPEVENEMLMAIDIGPNTMTAVIAVASIFAVAWLLRRAIQMRVIHSRTS